MVGSVVVCSLVAAAAGMRVAVSVTAVHGSDAHPDAAPGGGGAAGWRERWNAEQRDTAAVAESVAEEQMLLQGAVGTSVLAAAAVTAWWHGRDAAEAAEQWNAVTAEAVVAGRLASTGLAAAAGLLNEQCHCHCHSHFCSSTAAEHAN